MKRIRNPFKEYSFESEVSIKNSNVVLFQQILFLTRQKKKTQAVSSSGPRQCAHFQLNLNSYNQESFDNESEQAIRAIKTMV